MRSIIHAQLLADFHNRLRIIPDYEAVLEAGYRRLIAEGDVVLDIGAHCGRHTAVFAQLVGSSGHVYAFEPLPEQRARLNALSLGPTVTVLPFALSDHVGTSTFVHAKGAPEESGLRQRIYNNPELVKPETFNVQIETVDHVLGDLGQSKVDFVKIDIEGGEISCLQGAKQTLLRDRPLLTVEYGRPAYSAYGHTAQTLMNVAKPLDYVIGDLFGAVCNTMEEWEQVCDKAFWDYFLIPAERVVEWRSRLTGNAYA